MDPIHLGWFGVALFFIIGYFSPLAAVLAVVSFIVNYTEIGQIFMIRQFISNLFEAILPFLAVTNEDVRKVYEDMTMGWIILRTEMILAVIIYLLERAFGDSLFDIFESD